MGRGLGVAILTLGAVALARAEAPAPEIETVRAIVRGASALDLFRRPGTLAVSPDREFFVVGDTGRHRLVLFDASGRCRGTLPLSPGAPGKPGMEPQSLVVDARGRLYLVNALIPEIAVLSPRGRDLATLQFPEEFALAGGRPRAAALDANGRIYILHIGPNAGLYSESPGGRERSIHDVRSGLKTFQSPVALALSQDGSRVAILDPQSDSQVQIRSTDGTLIAAFGEHGEGEGTLSLAAHVAWGPGDTVWITDTLRHSISVFDAQGSFLGHVGGIGRGPGQFLYPVACGFLADDKLVVLERGSERYQILEIQFQSVASVLESEGNLFTRSSLMGGNAMSVRGLIAVVGAIAVASWSSGAVAGDYHYSTDLVCSDCHVMHYSQQHGYEPDGTGAFTPLGPGGPFHYLLRDDINNLCLSCHDGQAFAPDVFEAHGNGYVRQAGALNELGGTGLYPPTTGHTLNSTDVAPGSSPAWNNPDGLNCTDCHNAHGRADGGVTSPGGWRNLFPRSISYSRGDVEGTNNLTKWVFEDGSVGAVASHYGVESIVFNEPDATKSAFANFCQRCHTNFHGDVGGLEIGGTGTPPAEFVRHPASTANIGALGGGHSSATVFNSKANNVQVMSPTGQRPPYDTTLDSGLSPSCFSCHKGHGNQNAFGRIYMVGTGTITEEGDDPTPTVRESCRQCHVQGT